MIDKFCEYLTNKIRKDNPEIDDERAEVIMYGLQIMVGEVPKIFIMALIAWTLGILKWTLICFALMLPYRMYSGGFHLKTHIGCIIGTSLMYTGNAFISQQFEMDLWIKMIYALFVWIFAMSMIYMYAPADTEDVPIVSKKERKKRKYFSYVIVSVMIVLGVFIKENIVSDMSLLDVLLQTFSITKFAYNITNNKYGYEEYWKNKEALGN